MHPVFWVKLIESLIGHPSLRLLNLSHNRLLEDQSQKLKPKEIEKGLKYTALSPSNAKMMG